MFFASWNDTTGIPFTVVPNKGGDVKLELRWAPYLAGYRGMGEVGQVPPHTWRHVSAWFRRISVGFHDHRDYMILSGWVEDHLCSSVLKKVHPLQFFWKKLAQVHHGGALLEDVRAEAWWMGCQMRTVHRPFLWNWLLRGSRSFLDDKAITWYYMLLLGPSIWSITMGQRKESCPWAMRPWFSHKCQLLPCNLAASVAFSIFGRPESKFGSPKERADGSTWPGRWHRSSRLQ